MVIEFNNVKKRYSKSLPWVLDGLNLSVARGDICALIGNNGSGKTTIINLICNLIDVDGGRVDIFGETLKPEAVRHRGRIGFILSEPTYIPEFSVERYLKFVCKFQHIAKTEVTTRIADVAGLVGLSDMMDSKISTLSKGNQTKVLLCAALIHNPELLVLDEPFAFLDVATTQRLVDIIGVLSRTKTIFITSHDIDMVANLCNRFLILDEGKVVMEIHKQADEDAMVVKERIRLKLLETSGPLNNYPEWLK